MQFEWSNTGSLGALMKLFSSIIVSICLMSCASSKKAHVTMDKYNKDASEIIKLAKSNADKELVKQKALDLIETATTLLNEYKTENPECNTMLNFMIESRKEMTKLSLEKIEKDFHEGEALPAAPDKCYEPKELIIHPATVVILTNVKYNEEGRHQIVEELEEVIAHTEVIE